MTSPSACASIGDSDSSRSDVRCDKDTGRIHWLAIRPAFQGRGLAKAALFEALRIMAQWHQQAWLATSTGRAAAIRLYLHAGFQPDLRPAGAHDIWRRYRDQNPHPSLTDLDTLIRPASNDLAGQTAYDEVVRRSVNDDVWDEDRDEV